MKNLNVLTTTNDYNYNDATVTNSKLVEKYFIELLEVYKDPRRDLMYRETYIRVIRKVRDAFINSCDKYSYTDVQVLNIIDDLEEKVIQTENCGLIGIFIVWKNEVLYQYSKRK